MLIVFMILIFKKMKHNISIYNKRDIYTQQSIENIQKYLTNNSLQMNW